MVLYNEFLILYYDMMQRKRFYTYVDEEEFRRIQLRMRSEQKLRILTARIEGKPVSSIVVSLIGDTGLYLLWAAGDCALEMEASYLLHWKMVEELNRKGFRFQRKLLPAI
jgi:lipid II:glycine glycyltransferase (peptidoglycan interpeptide bridge formation enzyme)